MKKIILSLAFIGLAAIVEAGPIGPPNGPPYDPSTVILNSSNTVQNKTFNVPRATISTMTAVTVNAHIVNIDGVPISTNITSGNSIYPATGTIIASKGISGTTMTLTGLLNGTTVTITGMFNGATIHGSSMVITGTITGSNLNGTNTGDVTIGTGNGISVTGQVISLAAASTVSTGALRATDFVTFNNKLSPTGNGSGLTGLTKTQVGLGNVLNVDQTDASNLTSGLVDPTLLATGTASSARYLRGDSFWALLNSTAVGLGSVTNNAQVKVADYTQKGAILVGISPGIFAVFAPGNNGEILQSNSGSSYGYSWVTSPTAFTVYPATGTGQFPKGLTASTIAVSGLSEFAQANFTGLVQGTTVHFSSGVATGNFTAANLTGINTGDVTLSGTQNGLSLLGQILSLTAANSVSTGALTAGDWIRFNAKSDNSIYPATATASFPFGFSSTTGTFTSLIRGTTIQMANGFFSSTISASNFSGTTSGTNTGDLTLGTTNGLSLSAQILSLGTSGSTSTGSLTAVDWNTFNNKIATVTLSGTAPIQYGSGIISIDKSSATLLGPSPTTTVIPEGTNLYYTTARATTAITAQLPLINTSGTISASAATTTSTGVVTSTDWNTFNNKMSTSGATATNLTLAGTLSGSFIDNSTSTLNGGHTFTANTTFYNTYTTTAVINNIGSTFIGYGRNKLKNGEMIFNQRYEASTATVYNNGGSGLYYLDMVKAFSGQTQGVFTLARSSATPAAPGFQYYMRYQTSASTAVVAAHDFYALELVTEGPDCREFMFGTSQAKQINVSFWVRSSSAGTYGGNVGAQNGNRAWVFTYTIASPNVWQYVTLTLPGDVTGFWDTAVNTGGMFVAFDFGSGTDFNASTGTWLSADVFRTTTSNRLINVQGATWDLTGTQMEIGNAPTAYEFAPFESQLARLQRYYQKSYSLGVTSGAATSVGIVGQAAGLIGTTTSETGQIKFAVPMALNGLLTPLNINLYAVDGTAGQWTWYSSVGVGTKRNTTVNSKGQNGFDVFQTAGTELWTNGHWTAEAFLGD